MYDTKFSEVFKEEIEKEASTYTDKARDDEKKKKKHFAFGGKKKSRHGESGYGKGEEVEVDEEIFYWYIIKGDLANGKIVYAGNEKQVKLKRHDSRFGDGHVMTKSRKMKKVGEKWKKSMGVSEEVELDEMFFKITIPDLPPVFVEGDSGSKIRRSMKLKLRPDVYKDLDVERVSRADMAKKYRSLAKAEKEKEEEDVVKEGLDEVAPPGWEGTVKKMKGDKNIDNPWALAWWMKSKGYKSNANEEVWYREQNALEEDFVTNRMGGGNIEYRSPLLFSKKKQKLVKRKYPAGTMMAYEEVELTEALKPADKKVIDAFYKENSLVGKLLSSTGKSLEKHGVGGQTIAAWLDGKIAITAVSDVKSTEEILRYMKKSIPKLNFDQKSYKKFFEGIDIEKASMGAVIKDFQDSDAPQFNGKSDKKRKEMAIAAKLAADRNESVKEDEKDDPKSKKKDKINLKPKMDETMKNYKEFMKKVKEKRFQSEDADADMKAAREKKERERKRAAASRQTDAYRGIEKGSGKSLHPESAVKEVKDTDPDTKGTQGDDAEWKKARSEVLKKYGVPSCASIKDDKTKKQCFKDLDDSHVADHEEQVKKEEVGVDARTKGYKDTISRMLGKKIKEVKEGVTTGGIEYGEQDWDVQHRLENSYPNLDANFAEFYEQDLEGPYIWQGETYFFDRKVGSWYSVTAEDYVDDEMSKELSLNWTKDGLYKRQFAS